MKIFYIHYPHQLNKKTFNAYISKLPDFLKYKIKRYRRWQDQQAGMWGKLLLIKGLREIGLDKNLIRQIEYTEYQRPYFPKELGVQLDFNITHSGFLVACVFSEIQRTGIDVEHIRPIDIQYFTKQFSEKEIRQMYEADDTNRAFFERWCQKEAIIKVDGRGLSIPLPQVRIEGLTAQVDSQTFYLKPLNLIEDYVGCLASTKPIEDVEIEEIDTHSIGVSK